MATKASKILSKIQSISEAKAKWDIVMSNNNNRMTLTDGENSIYVTDRLGGAVTQAGGELLDSFTFYSKSEAVPKAIDLLKKNGVKTSTITKDQVIALSTFTIPGEKVGMIKWGNTSVPISKSGETLLDTNGKWEALFHEGEYKVRNMSSSVLVSISKLEGTSNYSGLSKNKPVSATTDDAAVKLMQSLKVPRAFINKLVSAK